MNFPLPMFINYFQGLQYSNTIDNTCPYSLSMVILAFLKMIPYEAYVSYTYFGFTSDVIEFMNQVEGISYNVKFSFVF